MSKKSASVIPFGCLDPVTERIRTLETIGAASKSDGDLNGGVVVGLALLLDGIAEVVHKEGAIYRTGIDHNGDAVTILCVAHDTSIDFVGHFECCFEKIDRKISMRKK